MSEAFRLGGWGMYPTAIVGGLLVLLAGRFALSPDRRQLPLLACLQLLTFLVACLGFVSGVIKSTTSTADMPNAMGAVVVGFGESLVNIGWGLVLMVLAMIPISIGVHRARTQSGSLVDPLRG